MKRHPVCRRSLWGIGAFGGMLLVLSLVSGEIIQAYVLQPTMTPLGSPPPSGPRRAVDENLSSWETMPAGVVLGPRDEMLPHAGIIRVLVELSDPPAARAYAIAINVLGWSEAAANRLAQDQMVRIEAAQQALLPTLTGPEIQAIVIDRVQRAMNGIMIEVDAARLDTIRQLPGVVGVYRLRIATLTGPADPGPVLGPQEPGYPVQPNAGSMIQ